MSYKTIMALGDLVYAVEVKSFDTEAELNAYIEGVNDGLHYQGSKSCDSIEEFKEYLEDVGSGDKEEQELINQVEEDWNDILDYEEKEAQIQDQVMMINLTTLADQAYQENKSFQEVLSEYLNQNDVEGEFEFQMERAKIKKQIA